MSIHYREPKNLHELEALFTLRQRVYSEDACLHKMVNLSSSLDINYYDLNALHFGAFENEKPIAYIRITTPSETHFTNWVKQILSMNNLNIEGHYSSYPFQSYYPDLNWSNNFIEGLNGNNVGEVGKLAIDKNYRQAGSVLSGLISSFIEYCKKDKKIKTGFGSCTLTLARYYRKFGFTLAQGAKPFVYADLPEAIIMRFDG